MVFWELRGKEKFNRLVLSAQSIAENTETAC